MWKRCISSFALFFSFFLFLYTAGGAALAACGDEPPAGPPDGFNWPAEGEITQSWSLDCRTDRGHRGVDISLPPDTPVKAAADGTVSFVGYTPAEGGGTTITIDHEGGYRSTYLHVTDPAVSKGQAITRGKQIATSTETALHFGLKLPGGGHDTYFDPMRLLPAISLESTEISPPAGETAPVEADREESSEAPAAETLPYPPAAGQSAPAQTPAGESLVPELQQLRAPQPRFVTAPSLPADNPQMAPVSPLIPGSTATIHPPSVQANTADLYAPAGDFGEQSMASPPAVAPGEVPVVPLLDLAGTAATHNAKQTGQSMAVPLYRYHGNARHLAAGFSVLLLSSVAAGSGRLAGRDGERVGFGLAPGSC